MGKSLGIITANAFHTRFNHEVPPGNLLQFAIETIAIIDLPNYKMVIFHSAM